MDGFDLNFDALQNAANKRETKTEWRDFTFQGFKCRLKVRNIGNDQYRIAQDRLVEQLRSNMYQLTQVSEIDETQFAKQNKIVAYHLISDWDGIVDRKTQQSVPFTHENLYTVLVYSGDLGVILHAWILEQATNLQNILTKEIEQSVGKPFSFTVTTEKASEEKTSTESEHS